MLQRLLSFLLLPAALLLARFNPPPAVPPRITLTETEPVCSSFQTVDAVHGAAESVFYILRPKRDALTLVRAETFGMDASAADNTSAFQAALDYCRAHPDTKLVISPGVYRFTQTNQIVIRGLRNVCIEARARAQSLSSARADGRSL